MGKRALVRFIMFYLILITFVVIFLGILLSIELKPQQIYKCEDGSVSEDPNGCSLELYFEEPGNKTIYLSAEPEKKFENCILNISGSALMDNVLINIGANGTINQNISLFRYIGAKSLDGWSKGQETGNTTIAISNNEDSYSINHSLQNASISWIRYDFGIEGIDMAEFDKLAFWSKCVSSNPPSDFGRWNIRFFNSADEFKCNILDYDIQYEDGTWKYHSNDLCDETKISDLRYIKIVIDQENSINATCLYNDFKFLKPQLAELNIDSKILNEHINKNENNVPIEISVKGRGNLIIKPKCNLIEAN